MGRFRRALLATTVLALAVAGCGFGENHDPYALLDRAWSTGWERVQVQLGFTLDTPNTGGDFMPIPGHMQIDPSAVTAIIDTKTRQWHLTVSIPQGATGLDPLLLGAFGPGVASLDAEVLYDGEHVFAKSPLLQGFLQSVPLGSPPIEGDLTGWLRLGSGDDLQSFTGAGNPLGMLLFGAGLPQLGALPLPAQGDPANLRQFFEDFGVVAEYKGTEHRNGSEAHHVAAGLDFEKLARSQRFATLAGLGRDQLQGVADSARQVAIGSDLWFDKATGRLVGLQLSVQTLQGESTKASVVLNLMDPPAGNPFEAPATFTDVPLAELTGGDNIGGDDGSGGGVTFATPAPMAP
jgi:hypothetical protein